MNDTNKEWVYKSSLHMLIYMPKIPTENMPLNNIIINYNINTNSMTITQKKKNFTFFFNLEDIARLTKSLFQGDELVHFGILANN